jgi:uncharacterized protein (TIGR02145 family)
MKTRNIIIFSGIVIFFLFCHSAECPWSKEGSDYVDLCFTAEPKTGKINELITFSAQCTIFETDCQDSKYTWSFGDGETETSGASIVYHQYNSPGEYLVILESVACYHEDGSLKKNWNDSYRDYVTVMDESGNESPHAAFTVTPQQGTTATTFNFDASYSSDEETPVEQLEVRWDWTNDGSYDTEFSATKEAQHQFVEPGTYTVTLQVKDADGATDQTSKEIIVSSLKAPVASFTIEPESGNTLTQFTFDASASSDSETPAEDLLVRWDFENDGNWDSDLNTYKINYHQYSNVGHYEVRLGVWDADQMYDEEVTSLDVINCINGGQPCPDAPTVNYGGQVYNTVQIGSQCWFRENLNVGTRINSDVMPTDNQEVEKYCYDDQVYYCDTYGGLYQWNEMMNYPQASGGAKGICPAGWHVPTESDFNTLAETLGWDVAGYKMKSCTDDWQPWGTIINSNESGFTALPAGYYSSNHTFAGFGQIAQYGMSDYSNIFTKTKALSYDNNILDTWGAMPLDVAVSVRCIKDNQ